MPKSFAYRALSAAALALAVSAGAGLAPLPLAPLAWAEAGARNPAAEQFVQTQAQRALDILSQHRGDPATEKRLFRSFVDQVADVPRITYFVLGKYSRTIAPAQRTAFAGVFREYASNVYESRLKEYHGETLRVTGSIARAPADVIVSSMVSGGALTEPLPVAWRVIGENGGWRVVDVQVKGVWLAITEQQDFVSTIDNAGGDINVLISQLQRQVSSEQAAPSQ
ncbi:MAG: ABC transporter substrate-binding protein [Caulobacteraceae bacterium]|nr:ABC transporter substrate-binding protein [Caulobacteraceae bacterium]